MDKFYDLTSELENMGGKTWNIGFLNNGADDETQFDLEETETAEDLGKLWEDFCEENDLDPECVTYVEEGQED